MAFTVYRRREPIALVPLSSAVISSAVSCQWFERLTCTWPRNDPCKPFRPCSIQSLNILEIYTFDGMYSAFYTFKLCEL